MASPSSFYDQWSQQAQRFSFAPFVELNSITTRLYSELMRQNLKAMNTFAQDSQERLQVLVRAKELDDVIRCQKEWSTQAAPQALKHIEQILDTILDSATEYRYWLESNAVRQAAEKTPPAPPAPSTPTPKKAN